MSWYRRQGQHKGGGFRLGWRPALMVAILTTLIAVPAIAVWYAGRSSHTAGTGAPRLYGAAMSDSFIRLSPEQLRQQLGDMKRTGFTHVRFTVSWYVVQPKDAGSSDWKLYDKVMQALDDTDMQGMMVLAYTPAWARAPSCRTSAYCPPADPQRFASFAAAVAERYAPRGLHYYEVWNEPNIKSFWQPTPSAAAYSALLKAAYPALKRADSQAFVISGGLSGVTVPSPGYIEPRTYLSDMYAAGAGGYFDALGYHGYTFPDKPSEQDGGKNAWSKLGSATPSLRSIMVAQGDESKGIWVTEVGAPTEGPGEEMADGGRRGRTTDHVSPALQATIAEQILASLDSLPWLNGLFWYNYKDIGTKQNSSENFYGLRDYDNNPKPAHAVFERHLR